LEYVISVFQKGGPIMYPLLFLGALAIALIIERLYSLSTKKIIPLQTIQEILFYLKERKFTEAYAAAKAKDTIATNIIVGILEAYVNGKRKREDIEIVAENIAKAEIPKLEAYINAIGAIAAISPLLGFLGTVTGMIQVFEALSIEGLGNPDVLAAGISQALLTTAFGLSIAIPTLAGYWYFRSRVNYLAIQLENIITDVILQLPEEEEIE
jgi:biopolymer transport protein ExbB